MNDFSSGHSAIAIVGREIGLFRVRDAQRPTPRSGREVKPSLVGICSTCPSLVLVIVLPGNSEDPATPVHRSPGIDETVDHRVDPFWARLVLAQELRGLPDDRQLAFPVPGSACGQRAAQRTRSMTYRAADRGRSRPVATISTMSPDEYPAPQPSAWPAYQHAQARPLVHGTREDKDVACRSAFREDRQLATRTGTRGVGQVNLSPDRAAVPYRGENLSVHLQTAGPRLRVPGCRQEERITRLELRRRNVRLRRCRRRPRS